MHRTDPCAFEAVPEVDVVPRPPTPPRILAVLAFAALASACFVEVDASVEGGGGGDGVALASRLETEFARKAGGATARIECPSELTHSAGHRLRCTGETSDGWTLDIAVLERGAGDFRWDVVESHRIR